MSNMIFPIVTEIEKGLPFYLTGVGCHYRQEHVKRPEGYPAYQWIQCHRGEGELRLGRERYRIKPRQGMFLSPNVPHEYYEVVEPWEVDWVGFQCSHLAEFIRTLGFEEAGVYYVGSSEVILAKMRRALSIAQSGNPFKSWECSALIYELLLDLYKYSSKSSEDSVQQQYFRLQPVFDFIEQHYAMMLSLEDLAGLIRVTPQYLCYLFKTIMKIRPFEYLNYVRINKSKEMLIGGRAAVQEIARAVGFDSSSYFCMVFKKVEGISPGEFRRLHGIT